MEYVYGTQGDIEVLQVKGDAHTDLTGYQTIVQEYPNQKVTDDFRVVRKLDSKEDQEGNCYDWYEIDHHRREIDRTAPLAAEGSRNAANIDYLSMMTGVELPGDDAED